VRLGGRRKQVAHRQFVHFQCRTHHSIAGREEVGWKLKPLQRAITADSTGNSLFNVSVGASKTV